MAVAQSVYDLFLFLSMGIDTLKPILNLPMNIGRSGITGLKWVFTRGDAFPVLKSSQVFFLKSV